VQGFAAPTPEPGTWTRVALGIALLLGTGRSRKRQGLIA
jgi:hypothetical protein